MFFYNENIMRKILKWQGEAFLCQMFCLYSEVEKDFCKK